MTVLHTKLLCMGKRAAFIDFFDTPSFKFGAWGFWILNFGFWIEYSEDFKEFYDSRNHLRDFMTFISCHHHTIKA